MMWELEEYDFKRRKTVLIKMTVFLSATVFWGQDGCPLTCCGEGKIMAFGGRWVWEGQEHPPASS